MPKPPATPPHSDLDGVHEDRKPRNVPENSDAKLQEESAARASDSKGRPNPSAEQGRS